MSLSWVSGTVAAYVVNTVQNATTPAGIIDGDALFALVMTRSALTLPAGWTVVGAGTAVGGGVNQTLSVCRKTTVVAANSSTAYTWTQATSERLGVAYAVVRATSALVGVTQVSVYASTGSVSSDDVALPVLTATADAGEIFLIATTASNISNPFTPSPPSGATLFTGLGSEDRLGGSYQGRSVGQSNGATATISNLGGSVGMAAIVLRLRDTVDPTTLTDDALLLGDVGLPVLMGESVAVDPTALLQRQVAQHSSTAGSVGFLEGADQALPLYRKSAEGVSDVITSDTTALLCYAYAIVQLEAEIQQTVSVQSTYKRSLRDALALLETMRLGQGHGVQESVALTSDLLGVRTAAVLDALGLAPILITQARVGSTVVSTLGLSDSVLQFFGLSGVDGVSLTSPTTEIPRYGRSANEEVLLASLINGGLVLRVLAPDTMEITASLALAWTANPVLLDGVVLDGAYLSPSGALVTWAMNTRNAAVSEYTRYGYTSFAKRGTRYLGTREDGLYTLDGDTDDGEPIIAHLRSGMIQMNGAKFSGFKAVYLGMHGTGEVLFRVVAGSGEAYTYRVVVQNMQSTKVRMGKGLRARYFAFELETLGADFDLDTVEFIPLTAQRRV